MNLGPIQLVSFEEFGKAFVPEKFRPRLRSYLAKAGIYEVPYGLFGLLFLTAILFTAIIYLAVLFPILDDMGLLAIFIGTFAAWTVIPIGLSFLIMFAIYSYVDIKIMERTRKIEDVLDDFLMLVSENLKGGMSLDKALWSSVKPEFGVLAREIEVASKKVTTGEDVEQALGEFIEKYDSGMTRRSFELIIEDASSGAQIATTIDKIVDDIKETKLLRQDLVATNTQYVIFITIIVLIISPLLFSLSYQLLGILIKFSSKLGPSLGGASVPFTMSELSIDVNDFSAFSRYVIAMVAVFSSMIISLINRGSIKAGLKYVPLFIGASLLVYQLFMMLFNGVFSSLVF